MTLVDTDIKKIAHLARLQISQNELIDYVNSLGSILALVDHMQQVNTDDVEPLANPLDQHQRLRVDQVTTVNQHDEFMALAPVSDAGLYLVPKVIE